MQNSSDQLIEVAEALGVSPEDLQDIDDKTNARLTEFYNILEDIKKRPDAEAKLAQLNATLQGFVGYDYADAAKAAEELAGAFATIQRREAFLPPRVYNDIVDALDDWIITREQWMSDPETLRSGLAGILTELFTKGPKEASASA